MSEMTELPGSTDVLVVGSGGAGLAAAWAASQAGARVTVITKGSPASCNTGKAQGGIQAAVGGDDR
jgi:succinate dehydrogenase/fumarate reductase flavoprotein subunit